MRAAILSLSALALVAFAFVQPARALSDSEVERFAASMPDVQAWSETHSDTLQDAQADVSEAFQGGMMQGPTEEQKKIMQAPMSYSVEQMSDAGLKSELARVVGEHGFSSPEEWASVGDRVMKAYVAIEMEGQRDYSAEVQQAMDQIRNNPQLSQEQKDQMLRMMAGANAAVDMMADVPQADVEAVRPHKDDLDRVIRQEEGQQ